MVRLRLTARDVAQSSCGSKLGFRSMLLYSLLNDVLLHYSGARRPIQITSSSLIY